MFRTARPAAVWKRILALILDLYIIIMVTASLLIVAKADTPATFTAALNTTPTASVLAALFFLSALILIYHTFCEYMLGQTLGMLLFSIKAAQKGKDEDLTFWQALGRNLFLIPILPFNLLWIVEPLHYVLTGERLLERWTSTTTLEAR